MINVSAEERAYRAKHFHEIRAQKNRQLNCCSCGNELNPKTRNVFAHPIIDILQCEICYTNKEESSSSKKDIPKCCCICGSSNKLCCCKNSTCQSVFCRGCIKRNASLSLLDLDQSNCWTCFICETKPLWKLRGVCAITLDSQSGRNKRSDKCEKVRLSDQRHIYYKSDTMHRSKSTRASSSKKRVRISIAKCNTTDSSDESTEDERGTQSLQNKRKKQSELSSSSKSDSDKEQPSSTLLANSLQRKNKSKATSHRNAKDEDSKSSSSHEFQQSKLTRANHSTLKKVSARNINAVPQLKTIQDKTKLTISEEQSFKFKLNVTEVLKKLKDQCWQFELKLDEIKCLNLRKDVKSLETANNILLEVTNIGKKFKADLEDQCKELEQFHKSWTKNCLPSDEVSDADEDISNDDIADDDIAHKDVNSGKEDEQKRKPTLDKESHESSKKEHSKASKSDQSVNKEPVTSDLDSDVIFSETEEKTRPYVARRAASYSPKATTMELHETEKSILENDDSSSSTLEDDNKKASKKGSISGLSDETYNTVQHDETIPNNATVSSPTKITSDDDIFNDTGESDSTLILTTANKSGPTINNDVEVSETEESSANLIEESHPTLEAAKCSNDKEQDNVISVDKTSHEKLVSAVISEAEMESELGLKAKSKSTAGAKSQAETKKKKETDKLTCSSYTKSMSDDNSDNIEEATKQALLDLSSDSDDSIDISFATNNDSNKNSKPDDDCTVVASISRKPSESDSDNATSHEEDNCEDGTHKNKNKIKQSREDMDQQRFSDISSSVRMKQNPVVYDYKLDKKYRSDKKLAMRTIVELRRMSKKHLRIYEKALKKSEEYLEHKKMMSLVDVDKLKKKSKKSGSTNSCAKDKAAKSKTNQKNLLDESSELMESIEGKLFSDSDDSDSVGKSKEAMELSIENISDTDKIAKELLLDTSDSEIDGPKDTVESSDNEQSKIKKRKLSSNKGLQKEDKSDEGDDKDSSKSKWRQDKMLTMKFSDSETEMEKEREKVAERRNNKASDDEEDQTTQDESIIKKRHRRRGRKRVLLSDSDAKESKSSSDSESSDNSGSDKKKQKKKKKKCVNNSSDADTSEGEKKKKRIKRRRIKEMDSDSDSQKSDGSDNGKGDNLNSSQGSLGKKGRKNIRKVLKDTRVAEDTKQAAKEEEERQKRIAEREKLYNELYEQRLAAEEKLEELVLDFNSDTKQPLVSVHKEIVKHLKPHQAEGIRFMWNSCFESLERLKTSQGSGCIIAHCMGLGKTLQVIGLVHTLLMHDEIGINTVMIVSPLSTVLNWVNEISKWLKDTGDSDDIEVYELTKMKTNVQRMYQLQSWKRTGGMLIIGYDMFRNLAGIKKNMRKNIKENILKCLVDPGPDLVVCDEGHLLKNEDTALSKCMNSIKTRRRVVLTGTPLQNNLVEYHCMVQFVKPSLLGTKQEFSNRFVNPINNGQYDDSTPYDVKLMKKRAYILNKMLKGSVQRFDYSVLTPFLPPKQEYVIFVSLSQVQIQLCQYYLDNFARQHRGGGGCLFSDFHALQRIWSHPLALQYNEEKLEKLNERKLSGSESEGSLKDFINDDSEYGTSSTSSSDGEGDLEVKKNHRTRANKETVDETINIDEKEPQPEEENDSSKTWWEQFVNPEHLEDMRVSGKLMLLFGILKECQKIGDKLLVFSQSLYTLRLIESFLKKVDSASSNSDSADYLCGHTGNWTLGADYFRLDGQTSPEYRNNWCKIFNKPTNTRARLFLISTKAGGLGINLTAANRVIIFDASWNPSQDMQSIFRIYRFGQKKPCYIYRFLAAGTMEEKIYNRQVTKLSLSCRVVDEQQIERHYTNNALNELYKFEPNLTGQKPTLNLPKDRLLADIFLEYKDHVENYHEHDSLLENKTEEELDEDERKQAWVEYEEEKKGKPRQVLPMPQVFPNNVFPNQFDLFTSVSNTELHNLQELIRKDYPNISADQQKHIAMRKLIDMYSYVERQVVHGRFTGNFALPNTQQVSGPIFVQQQQPQTQQQSLQRPQQQALQRPQQQPLQRPQQQQEARNDREVVVNPYAYASVGSSASRQTVDNDVIEINSVDTAVQVQNPPQSINRNQEE